MAPEICNYWSQLWSFCHFLLTKQPTHLTTCCTFCATERNSFDSFCLYSGRNSMLATRNSPTKYNTSLFSAWTARNKDRPQLFSSNKKTFFSDQILNQVNLFNLKVEKTTKSTLYIQRHFFLDEYHNMKVHQAPASYTQPKIPQYKPTVTEVMSASKFKNIPKES